VAAVVVERPAPAPPAAVPAAAVQAAAPAPAPELPRTGSTTDLLARVGLGLLLVGLALALAPAVGRRRTTCTTSN
jgi:hypothetical protein